MQYNKYPMRSLMFVPGNNIKFLNNAFESNADVLILDLEDSVQNKENKAIARDIIINSLKSKKNKKVFIRINDVESGEILEDIEKLMIEGVEGFMYPKSQSGLDIFFIDKLLSLVHKTPLIFLVVTILKLLFNIFIAYSQLSLL
jgi:citrate lyase subunit beta/citryl-CoA lyase